MRLMDAVSFAHASGEQLPLERVASLWSAVRRRLRRHFETGKPVPRIWSRKRSPRVVGSQSCELQRLLESLAICFRKEKRKNPRPRQSSVIAGSGEQLLEKIDSVDTSSLLASLSVVGSYTALHILEQASTPAALLRPVAKRLRAIRSRLDERSLEKALDDFHATEKLMVLGTSLLHKLPGHSRLVSDILETKRGSDMNVRRSVELSAFESDLKLPPTVREYVLRAETRRKTFSIGDNYDGGEAGDDDIRDDTDEDDANKAPDRKSKGRFLPVCAHRMYALIHEREFRVAVALSETEY